MSYSPYQSIDKASMMLGLISQKQQAVSANIANVNTPGYVRRDIDFKSYLGTLGNPLETKLSQKMGPSPMLAKKGGEVSAGQELIDLQKNTIFYTVATRRITAIIQELRSAAQVGK